MKVLIYLGYYFMQKKKHAEPTHNTRIFFKINLFAIMAVDEEKAKGSVVVSWKLGGWFGVRCKMKIDEMPNPDGNT